MVSFFLVLVVGLTVYAGLYFYSALVLARAERETAVSNASSNESVTVLVPSRNEGTSALRAIQSILRQTHIGTIEAILLIKDENDTSLQALKSILPGKALSGGAASTVTFKISANRVLRIFFAGIDAKSSKVNAYLPQLATSFVAILDGDHEADPLWIQSSLAILNERGAQIVQGRRAPILTTGFIQFWDSIQQHIGCESFNHVFSRLGLPVFFTGTTALMESRILTTYRLADCLTEDTDLSYRAILRGEKIVSNFEHGSCEEVSPDLYSFIARRRRWAHGHSAAFLLSLKAMQSSTLSLRGRVQILIHGLHYLVSFPIFLTHLLVASYFARELPQIPIALTAFASLFLGTLIVVRQGAASLKVLAFESAAIGLWVLSNLIILGSIFLNLAGAFDVESHLPLPMPLQILSLTSALGPLFFLFVGLVRFRQFSSGRIFVMLLTYPVALFST
jgi:cellulose synthase/poly-beta-1,6-N-acetylglucosamine synthase-like glycosyltransferase